MYILLLCTNYFHVHITFMYILLLCTYYFYVHITFMYILFLCTYFFYVHLTETIYVGHSANITELDSDGLLINIYDGPISVGRFELAVRVNGVYILKNVVKRK